MVESLFHVLPIFSAIPGFDLVNVIIGSGIITVLLVIFAESGLLIGFFLPGDSLLFTSGALYATGVLPGNIPISIHLFTFLLFIMAVLGDSVGYWFGRKAGPKIFNKPDARIFKQSHIKQAQDFYDTHGGKTIIIARFVPVVRTFAPIVAGVGKMHYRRFLGFNLIGGFMWTFGVTYLGYFAGKGLRAMGVDVDQVILPLVFMIIIISALPAIIEILKEKSRRDAIYAAIASRIKMVTSIFKKPAK